MSEVNETVTIQPKMKGRFSVYDTPDGGIHIVYQEDDSEESKHLEVPGHIFRMATMLESGALSPAKLMKTLMGGT
jgi:hypothetical protein